ncbi:MAG: DUF6029 family protein [Candidatus Hydrothermia bacterium]
MNFFLTLLLQFHFSVSGEYLLDKDTLAEYSSIFGNLQHSIGENLSLSSDFILQLHSDPSERIFTLMPQVSFSSSTFSLKLFDFQSSFQNGLVLAQEPDLAFKRLRYLRGLSAEIAIGQMEITALTGQPFNYDYDAFSFRTTNDTVDLLRGLSFKYANGIVDFEASYLRLNRRNMPEPYAFQEIFGCSWGLQRGIFDLVLNVARKWGVEPLTFGRMKGFGVHTFLNTSFPAINFSLSAVFYDSINFWGYNLPAVITEKELLPGSGFSDKGIGFNTAFYLGNTYFEGGLGSLVSIEEGNLLSPDDGKAFQETYLKTKLNIPSSVEIKLAREYYLRVEPEYEQLYVYTLESRGFFSWGVPVDYVMNVSFNEEDCFSYYVLGTVISAEILRDFSFGFNIEYATRKIPRYENEELWANLEIIYRFDYGTLTLDVGNRRGGLVCSGGMCRVVPPFSGITLGLNFGF